MHVCMSQQHTKCISEAYLLGQFYVLPLTIGSCRSNFLLHLATVYRLQLAVSLTCIEPGVWQGISCFVAGMTGSGLVKNDPQMSCTKGRSFTLTSRPLRHWINHMTSSRTVLVKGNMCVLRSWNMLAVFCVVSVCDDTYLNLFFLSARSLQNETGYVIIIESLVGKRTLSDQNQINTIEAS